MRSWVRAASEVAQVVEDFRVGPILSADEFAADHAVAVDDVGFGRARGVEGVIGLLREIEDGGDSSDVVIGEVLAVGAGVGVEADGEDDDVGHAALQVDEGREFFKAGRTPAGPEIEDNDFAAVVVEGDGLVAVVDDDGGRALADLGWAGGAVAGAEQGTGYSVQRTECGDGEPAETMPKIKAAEHVPIIRCRTRGRPAANAFRDHSRAQ